MGIKKFPKVIFCALIVFILTVFWFERDIIFQEGNPVPIAFGIAKLSFSGEDLIKVTSTPEKYLVRLRDGNEAFISYMENEGWMFTEQMGAGLIFERNGERRIYVERMFTRYYQIVRRDSRRRPR